MIAFRQVDGRYPVLWSDDRQPAGRWHAEGEGPAHYFADSADAAWAEFLRHEEITDPADLATIRRQLWVVDIGAVPAVGVAVPQEWLGGPDTYAVCQAEARRIRASEPAAAARLAAPSAAFPGGLVFVLYGDPSALVGQIAADAAQPPPHILERVTHYASS